MAELEPWANRDDLIDQCPLVYSLIEIVSMGFDPALALEIQYQHELWVRQHSDMSDKWLCSGDEAWHKLKRGTGTRSTILLTTCPSCHEENVGGRDRCVNCGCPLRKRGHEQPTDQG